MKRFFKIALLPLLFAVGLTFETSSLTAHLGDMAFSHSQFTKAVSYYRISMLTNPLQQDLPQHLRIALQMAKTQEILADKPTNHVVLGASTEKDLRYKPNFFEVILNKLLSLLSH